jgi:hypothetical protein
MQFRILLLASAAVLTSCGAADQATGANEVSQGDAPAQDLGGVAATGTFLYPGSTATGAADRFTTAESIDKVVAWYRDPTRRNEMIYASSEQRDDGYLVIGTAGDSGGSFALLLKPRSGGGTDIQSLPYDPTKGLQL